VSVAVSDQAPVKTVILGASRGCVEWQNAKKARACPQECLCTLLLHCDGLSILSLCN